MWGADPARLIRRIEDLLEEQRAALRDGDYDRLEALAERVAPLVDRLEAAPPRDAAALEALRARAMRLQELIEAAQQGAAAAQDRLRTLREGGAAFNSYGRDGARQSVGPGARSRVERKA